MSGEFKCPFCAEEIKPDAKKCRYCGEWLAPLADTISLQSTQPGQEYHATAQIVPEAIFTVPVQDLQKVCRQCGTARSSKVEFCAKCCGKQQPAGVQSLEIIIVISGIGALVSYPILSSLIAAVFFSVVFVICIMLKVSEDKLKEAPPQIQADTVFRPPTPEEVIKTVTDNAPDFQASELYYLKDAGIAIDSSAERICLFQLSTPNPSGQPTVITRLFTAKDIIEAEVIEEGYSQTGSVSNAVTNSITKTSAGSMIGRAVVGGVLLGPAGAVIGGATAKKTTRGQVIETTETIQIDKVSSVYLKLLVNDIKQPLYKIHFLQYETLKDNSRNAVEQANHLHARISVLMKRAETH